MTHKSNQFQFASVAFFGRSIDEYVAMFNLDLTALKGQSILDCPSGPAAFAKQGSDIGLNIIACDPVYAQTDVAILRELVDDHAQEVAKKQKSNRFLFHPQLTPASVRREAMEIFLSDYARGRQNGRYLAAALPDLPFPDQSIDLVLSGNFLFIYSDPASGGMMDASPFDYQFHKRALFELVRVCKKELRIYPFRGPGRGDHRYLQPLITELTAASLKVQRQAVTQRDIIGAEEMLLITRATPL